MKKRHPSTFSAERLRHQSISLALCQRQVGASRLLGAMPKPIHQKSDDGKHYTLYDPDWMSPLPPASANEPPKDGQKILSPVQPPPLPPTSAGYSSSAQFTPRGTKGLCDPRSSPAYPPAYPATPSQVAMEKGRVKYTVDGEPRRTSQRGERPGMATPRHLNSSAVRDVIFGGGVWDDDSRRGSARAARTESNSLEQQHTFGAPPPERPTVGDRAHLSRAHRHNDAVAHTIIFAHQTWGS